ncbi:tetratricopeptide repeat protein, partial [Pleomorphomonas koreensis]|uniref:tetratricopeptide repeat protein n=1 Tax=Pleomorphomonas koreensis TaxID=257440 RepID=UPI00146E7A11
MRSLAILLASSALLFAANGFAQDNPKAPPAIDVKGLVDVIKASSSSSKAADALHQLEQVADSGNANALYQLGDLYTRGGPIAIDGPKAIDLLQRAADAGNVSGYVRLGELYRDGTVVAADGAKAAELFQKAADAGNTTGKLNLGLMLAKGQGVPVDA